MVRTDLQKKWVISYVSLRWKYAVRKYRNNILNIQKRRPDSPSGRENS